MLKTVQTGTGGGGGSSNLVVGTTTITGGTSGNIVYDNAGVVGELSTSGANSVVKRDANQNVTANSFYAGTTSVAASGTAITMTAASTPAYIVTGSGGQTINLPDATTLPIGAIFSFNNNQSSGTIVVKVSGGGSTVSTIQSGSFVEIVLLANGSAAGTWDTHYLAPSNAAWSTNTLSFPGAITSLTGLTLASGNVAVSSGSVNVTEVAGTSAVTLTGATQTTSNPVLNLTQTWNSSGVSFKGAVLNITNTASATGSRLLDLQVGSTSKFAVDTNGLAYVGGNQAINGPYAAVSKSTTTSVGSSNVQIIFDTVGTDTNSAYNTSTGKYTPTVAGYYMVVAQMNNGSSNTASLYLNIIKNGTTSGTGVAQTNTGSLSTNYQVVITSGMVYLNGSTDYIAVAAYAASTVSITSAQLYVCMIRGA